MTRSPCASRLAGALLATAACSASLGVVACDGRPKAEGATETAKPPRSGPSIAVIDLGGGLPEQEAAGLLGVPTHRASFDRFVKAAASIGKDDDVKGVMVRFGDASIGLARSGELGEMLDGLRKANKPVYCHANGFSNATMLAAARGCSKIYLSPAGGVEAIGIAAQVVYLRKLLVDELHISVDILQVGKFKGAEEPLTRDGPSDEARASLEGVLADMRTSWLDDLKKGRGREDVGAAAEDGPYSPLKAKERGLIDEIGYADDTLAAVKKETGAQREDARFGGTAGADKPDDLGDVVRVLTGQRGATAPVQVIRASGSISMSGGGGLFGGSGGITEKELTKLLIRVEKDDDVKAVVLRIDSPGGSALASDLIWHHLMKVRAKKPLVVSVGEMAASGGYYLSCAGTVIFADATSIVGSIGVVGGKVGVGPALERFGVHAETFPANRGNAAAANRAAYLSPLVAWDDATKVRVLEGMTAVYDLFLARIAEGRKTTVDKIAPFAEGRIFSGRQGKEHGLVDEIGGLRDALARARQLAKLPADAAFGVVSAKSGLLEMLEGAGGEDDPESAASAETAMRVAGVSPIELLERTMPEAVPFASSMGALEHGERSIVALPFALTVR